jgi:hypothetical protein
MIIAYTISQFLAGFMTTDAMTVLENRSGAMFDQIFPYFLARLLFTDFKRAVFFLKSTAIIVGPLAVLGAYESITSNNPFAFFRAYSPIYIPYGLSDPRWGLYRATGAIGNSIMFGLIFAMLGSAYFGLRYFYKKPRMWFWIGVGLMGMGVFFSISSGSLMAVMFSTLIILFYKYRQYWKQAIGVIVFMCLMVEILSNRHFYEVVSRFTFSSATAWYRARLIEVALFEGGMSGKWLFGFGFEDPGWGLKIDGRSFTDMVNHYLLVLSRFGLAGFIPFIGIVIAVIKRLINGFKKCFDKKIKWLVWCFSAALLGTLITFSSVSIFSQPVVVFYILLGICSSVPEMVSTYKNSSVKTRRVRVEKKDPEIINYSLHHE